VDWVVAYFSPVNIIMAEQLTPQEIDQAIRAYNDALIAANGDLTKVSKTTVEAFNDAKAGIKNYTFQLNQSLKQLGNSVLGLGTAMLKGEQGASVYNSSIESAADAIDAFAAKFGFLGKLIGNLITAGARYVVEVNKQSDALFKSYQDLSRAGAASAGGITTVYKQMQQFGYNIEQLGDFGKLIKENSESLAVMGGTVNQGVKQFGDLAQGVQRSGLQTQFMQMGLTVDQINSGMAGYLKIQNLTGSAAKQTNQQLVQGAAAYIEQLDLLTKLTGKSSETLQKEQEENLSNERYALHYRELKQRADAGDIEAKNQLAAETLALSQVSGETKTAFQDTMAGYAASSEAGSKLFLTAPEVANRLQSGLKNIDDTNKTFDLLKGSTTNIMNQFGEVGKAAGDLGKTFLPVKEMMAIEALKGTAEERYAAAKREQEQQKNNLDAATKAQVQLRQDQMETTKAAQNLVNVGINPTTKAMQKLAGATESVVSKLPGTGADTGTSGSGRGGDPTGGGIFSQLFGMGGSVSSGGNSLAGLPVKSAESTAGGDVTEQLATVARAIYSNLSGDIKYFSAFNDKTHQGFDYASAHKTGTALDFVLNDPSKAAQVASMIQGMAGVKSVRDEYNNPSPKSSGGHIHVEVPGAEFGGILSGPKSGYQAMLHGDEAVIPLAGGRSIPVEMPGLTASMSGQMDMMAMQITKLDELIDAMRSNNDISNKILKAAKA
jgi:hypothetical protein